MSKRVITLPTKKLEELSDKNTSEEYLKTFTKKETTANEDVKYTETQKDFIREQVSFLPNIEKSVLHQIFWEDYSVEEVAVNLKKKVSTVEKIQEKALKRLKKMYLGQYATYQQNKEELLIEDCQKVS